MSGSKKYTLNSPEQTADFARRIGSVLQAGDILLLHGPIGAGKTHFARCLIQSVLTEIEDVPSPTFTIVQTYETRVGEIWHADLYRLSGPADIVETGLDEAMGQLICLIEWPDRLGDDTPENALVLTFETLENLDHRRVTLDTQGSADWSQRLEHSFDGL